MALFLLFLPRLGAGDGGFRRPPSPLCGPQRAVRPLCACYGITAVLLTVGLPELRGNYFFLFLGSAICSTVVEWIAGHLLEKATHTRWWDYSNRRGNLDGYICVGAFLLWGVLGLAAVQWINPLLLALYRWLPPLVGESCCGCCWPCWRRTSRAPC